MTMLLPLMTASAARAEGGTFWMPKAASTYAQDVDDVFYFIYYTDAVFFAVLMAAMILMAVKYRRKAEGESTPVIKGNHTLELAWSVFPTFLLVAMFWLGFKGWMNMAVPPADAMEVRVIGQKWNWTYQYPAANIGGVDYPSFEVAGADAACMERVADPTRDIECNAALVVPAGKPVKLVMNSRDVLHSFFVPDFRMKRDVIPGRYTQQWFEAPEVGEHNVFCTEYCGDRHGYMYSKVEVKSPADFEAWKLEQHKKAAASGLVSGAELGAQLFASKGCAGCHKIDGTKLVGPWLNGKFGAQEQLADGSTVTIDEGYLRESILVPGAKIVAGYPPSMPPYQGQLDDRQVEGLIEYIKSLK